MRLFALSTAIALLTSVVVVMGGGPDSKVRTSPPNAVAEKAPPLAGDKLIVHEWGTFTSFSGSDGVRLEYRPLLDEDLPPFVLDRFLQSGVPTFTKAQIRVRMRMETPVTYFYTDRERDVNVRVAFPEGLLTEFYPPVARMEPQYKLGEKLPIKDSLLDWGRVHLIPASRLQAHVDDPDRKQLLESRMLTGLIPPAEGENHYFHARETDSALVQISRSAASQGTHPGRPYAPTGDFFEKFLFYRGVGNFTLPLTLSASGEERFELVNDGGDPIRSLFLVDVEGERIRFTHFDGIPAGGRLTLTQSAKASTIDALANAVTDALIGEGLYEKEAKAMVNTWRSSWFGEQGTRLFYIVPQRITDELLPLEINPSPDETVRVLVGRMEIMTPEQEARATELVRQSAERRKAADREAKETGEPSNYAWPAELDELGRLAEPALVRVRATTDDPAIRTEARLLLETLETRNRAEQVFLRQLKQ